MSSKNVLDWDVNRKHYLLVRDFYERYRGEMNLVLLTGDATLDSKITEKMTHRPGLALAGFTDVYSNRRIQVLGSTEWAYLESLGPEGRKLVFAKLARFPTPLWVLTHSLPPHEELLAMCEKYGIPLLRTKLGTQEYVTLTHRILAEWFAPYSDIHASLVDVYGVGMLYVGDSNIGKSECVLDLVERGHRLVADDSVRVRRIGDAVIGGCNSIVEHHMEIRGIGVIDIPRLFGIHAVRRVKKIELIVELQFWSPDASYERTGLDEKFANVLGVDVPKVVIPVSPGKNITVISEVMAMNQLMKLNGVNVAQEFNDRIIQAMHDKGRRSPESELGSAFGRTDELYE